MALGSGLTPSVPAGGFFFFPPGGWLLSGSLTGGSLLFTHPLVRSLCSDRFSPKFAFTRKIWVFSGFFCWGKTFFAALCEAYSPKTPFTAELSSSFEKKLSFRVGEIYVTDEEEWEWGVEHGWQGGTSATGALDVRRWDAAQRSLTRSRLGTGHDEIKLDCESMEV